MAPFEPQIFGKYHLIRRIALGGMAEIFLAKAIGAEGFRRDVVIKRILPSYSEDEAFITMFIDEARVSARLHHQNIVQILDFDRIDDSYYIAMEYVDGRDLRKVLDRGISTGKRLTPLRVAHAVADIASGLRYAHLIRSDEGEPLNIVHRDVSPHNILMGFSGEVKLTDFGIAKAAARATKTRAGTVKGKCAYMSPEQARGKQLDGRSDLFALCTIAWEMLTYQKLFDGDGDFEILNNVVSQEVAPPSSLNPDVPPELDEIVLRGLERDLDRRWPDMGELERALRNFEFKNAKGMDEVQLGAYLQDLFAEEIAAEGTPTGVPAFKVAGDGTPAKGHPAGSGSKPAVRSDATPSGSDPGKKGATLVLDDDAPRPTLPPREAPAAPVAAPSPAKPDAASEDGGGLVATVPVSELQNELEDYLREHPTAERAAEPTPHTVRQAATPAAVKPVAAPEPVVRAAASGPVAVPRPSGSRKGLWIGVAALALVAVAAGGYFGLVRGPGPDAASPAATEPVATEPVATEPAAPETAPAPAEAPPSPTPAAEPVAAPVAEAASAPQEAQEAAPAEATAPQAAPVAEAPKAAPSREAAPEAPAAPAPQAAMLRISVNPATATITIDGREVKGTSARRTVEGLEVGQTVDVLAKSDGYKDFARRVEIASAEQDLPIRLVASATTSAVPAKPATREVGYVTINAKPWADVYLRGRKVGTTPVRDLAVEAGKQTFVLKNQTGSKRLTVKVEVGKTSVHVVDM